jgi:mRNA interferase YafQ
MLTTDYSSQFKKDRKKLLKNPIHKNIELLLWNTALQLQKGETLAPKYRDHALTGNLNGLREFHLKSDVLVIYRMTSESIFFMRIGSHSDLFS